MRLFEAYIFSLVQHNFSLLFIKIFSLVKHRFDPDSVASVLDDKSHLLETRDRYSGYQIETRYDYVSEEQACRMEMEGECGEELTPYVPGLDIMYEDEYDDTYDSQNVGAADDATDEQFVVKR